MLQPTSSRCARPALLAVAFALLLLCAGGRPPAARDTHGAPTSIVASTPTLALPAGVGAALRPGERSGALPAAAALLGAFGLALLAATPRRPHLLLAAGPLWRPTARPAVDRHWLDGQRPAPRRGPPPLTP